MLFLRCRVFPVGVWLSLSLSLPLLLACGKAPSDGDGAPQSKVADGHPAAAPEPPSPPPSPPAPVAPAATADVQAFNAAPAVALAGPKPPEPSKFGPACKPELKAADVNDMLTGTLHFVTHYREHGQTLSTHLVSYVVTLLAAGIGDEPSKYRFAYDAASHSYTFADGNEGFTVRLVYAQSTPFGAKDSPLPANVFSLDSYLKVGCRDTTMGLCEPGCVVQVKGGPLRPMLGLDKSDAELAASVLQGCADYRAAKAKLAACKDRVAAVAGGEDVEQLKRGVGALLDGQGTLNDLTRKAKQAGRTVKAAGAACAEDLENSVRELADATTVARKLVGASKPRWDLVAVGVEARSRQQASNPKHSNDFLELSMKTPNLPVVGFSEAVTQGNLTLTIDGTRYTSQHYGIEQHFRQGGIRLVPNASDTGRYDLDGGWLSKVTRKGETWFAQGVISSTKPNETWWFCDEGQTSPFGRSIHDLDLKGGVLVRPDGSQDRYGLEPF